MAMVRCYRADAVSHGYRLKQSMDRIDDTSEPTAAPITAPPSQQFRPVAYSDASGGRACSSRRWRLPGQRSRMFRPLLKSRTGAPWRKTQPRRSRCRPGHFHNHGQRPPRRSGSSPSLRARRVSLAGQAHPTPTQRRAPMPRPRSKQRSGIRPAATADRPTGRQPVDATLSDIDAEASAGSPTAVEARIAEALRDVQTDGQDNIAEIPTASDRAFDALVAEPSARPDLTSAEVEPRTHATTRASPGAGSSSPAWPLRDGLPSFCS